MNLEGKRALVTGAGSGIGRWLAYSLGTRGCHLVLVDKDRAGLEETMNLVASLKVESNAQVLDVTDQEGIKNLAANLAQNGRGIDLLINNAGIASGGSFLQVSEAVFDRVIDVNFLSLVRITRVFLPYLQQSPEASIVNISSIYGIVSPIEQTAYSASKFAVRGFSNALRHELAGSNVSVTVVHPGGIATNIARNAAVPESTGEREVKERLVQMDRLLRMPPQKAAEIIVRGIQRNKARILVGSDAKFVALIERLMPVNYWKLLLSIAKRKSKRKTAAS